MWKWSTLKRFLRKSVGSDISTSGAIMWPAVYPLDPAHPEYRPREPHSTIVYLGDITDVNYTKEEVIDAIKDTYHSVFLWVYVEGLDWFGPEENIPVLRVHHDYMRPYHDTLTKVLKIRGIPFSEEYDYSPHITITPQAALDEVWPKKILLSPVELWWGGEHIKISNNSYPVTVGM